jgi:hypothetical protein
MPAKHDDASRRVPLSALFGSHRQRTTGLKSRFRNQACSLPASLLRRLDRPCRYTSIRPSASPCTDTDDIAYHPPSTSAIALSLRCCSMQRASETTPADASGSMERRCSAFPPLSRFAYHRAWRDRFPDEAVPPDVGDSLTFESQPPVMRRVPASQLSLDASRVLASRALKYRTVPVTQRNRGQRQGLSPLLHDDGIAAKARAAPQPHLRTQQAAERPSSAGGDRRRRRLLTLRWNWRFGVTSTSRGPKSVRASPTKPLVNDVISCQA